MTEKTLAEGFSAMLKEISDNRMKTAAITNDELEEMIGQMEELMRASAKCGWKKCAYVYDQLQRKGELENTPIPRQEIDEITKYFNVPGLSAIFMGNIICRGCKSEKCYKGLRAGYVFCWL